MRKFKVGDRVEYLEEPRKTQFGKGVVRFIHEEIHLCEVEFENVTGGITKYDYCNDKSKGWLCDESLITKIN